ncbi:MAG TPA: single-stranded-DNA-specific exonuclease RecJ [Bacteroidia bacterium]|nr:single-stranded-DNA-specific exonuclease RecJ [Bacteroidia bacterium]HNT79232.1 single-stranded-DNA-specific exonuclease RecJ [Bacteroidia bacterium]
MIQKRWVIKPDGEPSVISELSNSLNLNPILCNLLFHRGITNYKEAEYFFRPQLEHLHDPFLMKDMDKAVARICKAFDQKEKILVFGDYDVDGTSAVALFYSFLREFYPHIGFYIPDRYEEGYGVSIKGIDWAHENGYSLIVCLDCGIKAIEKIDYAKTKNIDFIVCDHHRPGDQIPSASAVLDPKRNDCDYPYKELSGCGIGFKFAEAIARYKKMDMQVVYNYLDLVAISIASDIVPITGENRVLAYYGLKQLNQNPRAGVKAIIDVAYQSNKELDVNDIVFVIAPRINAAGRLESGSKAVELLISESPDTAMLHGYDIDKQNVERKNIDQSITSHALDMIGESTVYETRKSIVVYHPEWHKGVIGIVASRLADKFYKPTIVLTKSNGHIAGSARSVRDFDVYNAIDACSDLLEQFGGHMYAAGLTMSESKVESFIHKFEEVVSSTITPEMEIREVLIDAELDLNDITPKFYNIIKQFAPFGPGNLSPVFLSNISRQTSISKIVGNNHLKLAIRQSNGNGTQNYDGIGFQMGDYHSLISKGLPYKLCYHLEENHYNNRVTLQMNIKDLDFE